MQTLSTQKGATTVPTVLWTVLLVMAIAMGLKYFMADLRYYTLTEDNMGRFFAVKWWLVFHLTGGITALLIGPFQFWSRMRNKWLRLHRTLGKIYLMAIVVAALASTWMAWTSALKIHITWSLSLQILALAWLSTAGMAYYCIRRGKVQQHKEWMVRSYLVTLVFLTFRIANDYMGAHDIGTFAERAPSIIYVTLFVPLLLADIIFQLRKR